MPYDPKYGYDPARDHGWPTAADYNDIIRLMQQATPARPIGTRESTNVQDRNQLSPLHQFILQFLQNPSIPAPYDFPVSNVGGYDPPDSIAPYYAERDMPSDIIPQPTSRFDFGRKFKP